MARLYLFAEGLTEQTFADTVLKPHLANFGVYMQKPTLIAHSRKKGRIHRGGGRTTPIPKFPLCMMSSPQNGSTTGNTRLHRSGSSPNFPNTNPRKQR